jgi:hypothetical protein
VTGAGILRKSSSPEEPITAADAADIIAMPNHPSVYYFAVDERGWPEDRFERWLADPFTDQLLR